MGEKWVSVGYQSAPGDAARSALCISVLKMEATLENTVTVDDAGYQTRCQENFGIAKIAG